MTGGHHHPPRPEQQGLGRSVGGSVVDHHQDRPPLSGVLGQHRPKQPLPILHRRWHVLAGHPHRPQQPIQRGSRVQPLRGVLVAVQVHHQNAAGEPSPLQSGVRGMHRKFGLADPAQPGHRRHPRHPGPRPARIQQLQQLLQHRGTADELGRGSPQPVQRGRHRRRQRHGDVPAHHQRADHHPTRHRVVGTTRLTRTHTSDPTNTNHHHAGQTAALVQHRPRDTARHDHGRDLREEIHFASGDTDPSPGPTVSPNGRQTITSGRGLPCRS